MIYSSRLNLEFQGLALKRMFLFSRGAENRTRSSSPTEPGMSPGHPVKFFVGVPRIELGHLAPKASVLPVYDTPTKNSTPKQAYYRYTTPR